MIYSVIKIKIIKDQILYVQGIIIKLLLQFNQLEIELVSVHQQIMSDVPVNPNYEFG